MSKSIASFDDLRYEEPSKEMNSMKSLLPFYVHQILADRTSSCRRLSHQDIISILDEYPYGISVDRRALGRCINTLEYAETGVHTSSTGSWYEEKDDWFVMNRPGKWHSAA